MLAEIEGLERIRFMTSHPKDLSDKLIEAFRTCDKLCKYIHLPVQAGSDKVLKEMNRKYTGQSYLELVDKLRRACPDIAISLSLIHISITSSSFQIRQKTVCWPALKR